ncbi:MAG TPA: hypothetical protein VGR29_09430, partial [Thermomicrobiales bacterium]|nr:hypothetical protein [Thermomicrobiales bacterium]
MSSVGQTLTSRAELALNPIFRKGILGATNNTIVARTVRRYGMKLGASRFVAGETLDECLP